MAVRRSISLFPNKWPHRMNTRKILLAEDDPLDAKLTLGALNDDHVADQVIVVSDGEEVLDYLYCRGKFEGREEENPIALLLDLKMPKIDGLKALKIIKADQHLKTTPVVMLTSSREKADLIECYENGVNAYVVKPVDFTEFAAAIKGLGVFWAAVSEPPPVNKQGSFTQAPEAAPINP